MTRTNHTERRNQRDQIIAGLTAEGHTIETAQADFFHTTPIKNTGPGANNRPFYRICYTWEGHKWEGFTAIATPKNNSN